MMIITNIASPTGIANDNDNNSSNNNNNNNNNNEYINKLINA